MALPISLVNSEGIQLQGLTRDISSSAVSLFSTIQLAMGAAVTFTIQLPSEVTLAESVRAHCKGHIVRIEPQSDGRSFVIVIRIDTFEVDGFCEEGTTLN
jgi:hypothetical protein